MDSASEDLALEIINGTYTPAPLASCEQTLPVDRNPQAVRFRQFLLFADPGMQVRSPNPAEYLILQQYEKGGRGDKPSPKISAIIAALSKRLASRILGNSRTTDLAPATLPDPEAEDTDVERLRAFAIERRLPGYSPNWSETEVRSAVKQWIGTDLRSRVLTQLEALERAGGRVGRRLRGDLKDLPGAIADALEPLIAPDPYQPFDTPHAHFALCATYEQVWEPVGYTRGELINTISLAPGEQLTVEVHSWDKRTVRTEEEISVESESRVTENLTQRDSKTVSQEVAKNFSSSFTGSGDIPIKMAKVVLSGTASYSVNAKVTRTRDEIRERTVQASNTLKTSRKLHIEVSREVGRERKQTHVIANTNRCHTLNCHYFEVMSSFIVRTKLRQVDPCLLVPSSPVDITPEWVLCHESVLRETLMSDAYLGGFDGARVLATHEAFEEVKREAADEELRRNTQAILNAFDMLQESVGYLKAIIDDALVSSAGEAGGSFLQTVVTAAMAQPDRVRQVLYMAILRTNMVAYNALVQLKTDIEPPAGGPSPVQHPSEALRDFFSSVTPKAYRLHINAALGTGLALLGIDRAIINALIGWGFVWLMANDAGLYNAAKAAYDKVKALDAPEEQSTVREGFSFMEVARARVAFEQLKCHIEDHWVHYLQAMWLNESADERFVRLQSYGNVAAILDNDILGFLGNKVGFLITDTAAVRDQIKLDELTSGLVLPEEQPVLVTVPTQGTVLEAMIGECDACEPFIQQSREIDVRVQEANAQKEEQEVRRLQMRLDADPPQLDAPQGTSGNKVTITVDGGTENG